MWELFGFTSEPEEATRKSEHRTVDATGDGNEVVEEALECDYERNCTSLYKYIEEEDWLSITKFLETGYWPGNFFADAIPPADQVRTWVTRFDSAEDNRVRWSQLPLHLAIVVEAPYHVIGSLIELYPEGVRCTDDQHMLPLHLAMRHGSSDNVVDLLLAAFPEAVNAKGKNDRTPIDCAIRGPNKVRGRILGTFVERAKAKATKSVSNSYSRELAGLRSKLEDKETELGDVKSKLAAVDTAKAALELNLSKMPNEKPDEDLETHKKITALEQEKADLQRAQERAQEEEKALIAELETLKGQVEKSASPKDILALKEEIEKLKESRAKAAKEKAEKEVEEMKQHIAEQLSKADEAHKEELKAMQQNIEQLHRVASTDNGTDTEIATLKGELELLRKELKDKEESARLKAELALLKESLEGELRDTDTKTKEQIATLKEALESTKLSHMEDKMKEELVVLKDELQTIKGEMKQATLAEKMTEDVVGLRRRVEELDGKATTRQTKQDIDLIKRTLDAIKVAEFQNKSDKELRVLNQDVKVLKDQVTDFEEVIKTRAELTELKKELESELKEARGSKKETAEIKTALKKIRGLESKSKFELVSLKFELVFIQRDIKVKHAARETNAEIADLQSEIAKHLKVASGKNKDELSSIKTSLDGIGGKTLHLKGEEGVENAKSELKGLKKRLADQELALRLKKELREQKKYFEAKKEFPGAPEMAAKLGEESLDHKTTQELIAAKDEATLLENDLKEKDQLFGDILTIKKTLDELLLKKEGKAKQDLETMKGAVDAIDLADLDKNNDAEWEEMKAQIAILKKELSNAGIADKTKDELALLKEALETAIAESQGDAKEELTNLKGVVDAIDVSKMDASKHEEWENLKKEIDALKKELKMRECQSLVTAIEGQLKNTRTLSKVELSRLKARFLSVDQEFSSKTYTQLMESKAELEVILEDIPKRVVTPRKSKRASGFGTPEKPNEEASISTKQSKASKQLSSKAPAAAENVETPSMKQQSSRKNRVTPTKASPDKASKKGFFGRLKKKSVPKATEGPPVETVGSQVSKADSQISKADEEPSGKRDSPPQNTEPGAPKQEKPSGDSRGEVEKKQSVEDNRDNAVVEEKKEDDDGKNDNTRPPRHPVPPKVDTDQPEAMAEIPVVRTSSKTVVSPTGDREVEAVVVSTVE